MKDDMGKTKAIRPGNVDMRLGIFDLLDALPFYVLLVDEYHHILYANNAVRVQLGADPENIVGEYCPRAIHGTDQPIEGCPLEEAAAKKQVVEREIRDPKTGRWLVSAIYPTTGTTSDGRRIFFHLVTDINDRKTAEEQLKASREQLLELSRHLESVREEERTRLAREIHDELGQILTGLKIDISWITKKLPGEEQLLIEKTKAMNELIDIAIETVKRISGELRPGALDYLGIAAAIEWQIQEIEKRIDIKFKFKSSHGEIVLDPALSTAIFRICQEALTNVIRHAGANKVKVTLTKGKDSIILIIADNGKGIEEKHLSDPRAFGIIGMRERARPWGGEVMINGVSGQGTTVTVKIPLTGGEDSGAENTSRR
jgi:PAS domain S-box-containing protein